MCINNDEYMLVSVDEQYIVSQETYKTKKDAEKACEKYNLDNKFQAQIQNIGYCHC